MLRAREVLITACRRYPWNWSAWQALASSCLKLEHLHQVLSHRLIDEIKHCSFSYMFDFFQAHAELELQLNSDGLARYKQINQTFTNPYVMAQTAVALFNLRGTYRAATLLCQLANAVLLALLTRCTEYSEASCIFEVLRQENPYRLDTMDIYSNILYVTEERSMLSVLAQFAVAIDKYRPETCFIIGNVKPPAQCVIMSKYQPLSEQQQQQHCESQQVIT
jgi:anaphase-promoting complex subunit 8